MSYPYNISIGMIVDMPAELRQNWLNTYGAAAAEFEALRAKAQTKLYDYSRGIDPDPAFVWLLRARVEHYTRERDRLDALHMAVEELINQEYDEVSS